MQVTRRAREATPGPSRILRTLKGVLVGRAIYWRLFQMHLAGGRPLAGHYAGVYGEVLKSFLVGRDDAQLLFSWSTVATLFSPTLFPS